MQGLKKRTLGNCGKATEHKVKRKGLKRSSREGTVQIKRLMITGVVGGPVRCGTMGIHIYYKWKGKLVQLLWNMVFYYLSKFLVVKNLPAM